jgi:hypothetical protein
MVESIISQVVSSPCHIRCVLSPKGERQPQLVQEPPRKPQQKDASEDKETPRDKYSSIAEDPLIQEAVNKYGARVVDVQ